MKGFDNTYSETYAIRNKRRILCKLIAIIILAAMLFAVVYFAVTQFNLSADGVIGETKPNFGCFIGNVKLYSEYGILVDLSDGEVIAEKGSTRRIYPASLTKIMTALLLVENCDDLYNTVTIPYDIYPALYEEEASMAGFEAGEEVTFEALLYGILLPSGAECCMTCANWVSGSESAFVELMNEKAHTLGMNDTHFCNCTGLHEASHYSTVNDISVLLKYALQYNSFRNAFTSSSYSVPPTDYHIDGFTFFSTMFSYMDTASVAGGEILGGKTGYTEEAGLCLASLADICGRKYVLVTAKADGTHETQQYHISDAFNVYNEIGGILGE
ncbi:MAG: D-alanyl-D-alanine carboxypeptidase [Lachnospiraceae bacterium]|nr:D-alanyl-D-alanine carboxypeptidase [Lachnospiraceae bacterium]